MKVPKEIVQQDATLAMLEHKGLVFLLRNRSRELYNLFLTKPEVYKQQIREIARKY